MASTRLRYIVNNVVIGQSVMFEDIMELTRVGHIVSSKGDLQTKM